MLTGTRGDMMSFLKEKYCKCNKYKPLKNEPDTNINLHCFFMEDDDCVTCEVCGYNLCSQECGEGELHREECKVLARGERGAQVGYRVIGILRLLGARRGNRWKEIGDIVVQYC